MKSEHITLITTGGTIDKWYGCGAGVRDMHAGEPFAPGFLPKVLGSSLEIRHRRVLAKDSLDLTNEDRAVIGEACLDPGAYRVVITHGTDTMTETAAFLHGFVTEPRVIVLTGALQPAAMRDTDAEFNLGLAIAAALAKPPGIYIAMHGVHEHSACVKDPDTGYFLPTDYRRS